MKLIKSKSGQDIAVIDGDQWISRWVQESGRLDHDQNALPRILRHIKPGDVVVDGGAFIGDHTVAYAKAVGHTGYVYAFEPNPEAHECLRFNVRGLPVAIFQDGLADDDRFARPHRSENAGASHLEVLGGGVHELGPDGWVRARPLDGLSFHRLNLLKLDIEGFEVRALKGAAETIKRCRPVLVVEVNEGALNRQGSTGAELLQLIMSYRYEVKDLYGGSMTGPQFDVIGVPV